VGRRVKLAGGFHSDAVYLDDASMGSGAQVRGGTLLEEKANGAHTVGLKQTILLPFVTLGSLVNFCDALMAGGTSREDHSEVGSSFIHFNFTPFGRRGDKATASLIGDVPRGVMLRSRRIFLGGQAGLAGPLHIDYGTVLAAGFVYRLDHGPDELVVGERLAAQTRPFRAPAYRRVRSKVVANLRYIGNLAALWHWYDRVRVPMVAGNTTLAQLYRRAQRIIGGGIEERIKRLAQLVGYMPESIRALESDGDELKKEIEDQRSLVEGWPAIEQQLAAYRERCHEDMAGCVTLGALARQQTSDTAYVSFVQGLPDEVVGQGTQWLDAIVQETVALF
jgi:UDP-N-acetylglucosamine/UDP-N-acetylgalactosamine diphosphorylase